MNKFDKSKAFQSFNRSSDIEVSPKFVADMERLCLAAYASGNIDMYVTGMNSLAKVQKAGELDSFKAEIKEMLNDRS